MRALVIWLALSSVAYADIAPSPERPEWDYTPLPMPEEALVLLVLVIAMVGAGVVLVRRNSRERTDADA